MTHLMLLCCAGTAAAREGGFANATTQLDEGVRRKAAAFRLRGPAPARLVTSPAHAAAETAALTGLAATIDPRLADMDHGDWAGRTFAAVHQADPAGFAAWLVAPEHGAPGGETFDRLTHRIRDWLGEQAATGGRTLGVTHPMPIRAALCVALGTTPAAAMRIDLPPLGLVRLSYDRGWRLQSLTPA